MEGLIGAGTNMGAPYGRHVIDAQPTYTQEVHTEFLSRTETEWQRQPQSMLRTVYVTRLTSTTARQLSSQEMLKSNSCRFFGTDATMQGRGGGVTGKKSKRDEQYA